MSKRIIFICVCAVLIILCFGIFAGKPLLNLISGQGFDITVVNRTDINAEGLKITCSNNGSDISLPVVKAHSSVNINVNLDGNFSENSMHLYYFDKNGEKHDEVIIEYFEKGYAGTVKTEIKNINNDGVMSFHIYQRDLHN